jgi:Cu/Ag efflux protein CusF
MRRVIFVRSVVVTAAAALLVAGCGGGASTTSTKDPKAAFSTGLSGLSDTDALTVTMKFETTADDLMGFAKESDDNTLDPAVAKDIATGELTFEFKTTDGTKLSKVKPGDNTHTAARIAFSDNGTSYAEIRVRDGSLYVRADVKGLLDLFGQPKTYDELQARAATLPPFVKAFVANQWVSVPNSVLTAIASQFGGAASSPNPAQSQKLVADLKAVIGRDVTVTRVGTDDQGDHLRLTTQSRKFIADFLQAVGDAVPGAGLALSKFDASKVPDHSIVLDAWVNDGALAKLSFDFVQFAKPGEAKPGDHLPLVLTFDRSGDDISKPDGATPIDLSQLGSLFGGLGG